MSLRPNQSDHHSIAVLNGNAVKCSVTVSEKASATMKKTYGDGESLPLLSDKTDICIRKEGKLSTYKLSNPLWQVWLVVSLPRPGKIIQCLNIYRVKEGRKKKQRSHKHDMRHAEDELAKVGRRFLALVSSICYWQKSPGTQSRTSVRMLCSFSSRYLTCELSFFSFHWRTNPNVKQSTVSFMQIHVVSTFRLLQKDESHQLITLPIKVTNSFMSFISFQNRLLSKIYPRYLIQSYKLNSWLVKVTKNLKRFFEG